MSAPGYSTCMAGYAAGRPESVRSCAPTVNVWSSSWLNEPLVRQLRGARDLLRRGALRRLPRHTVERVEADGAPVGRDGGVDREQLDGVAAVQARLDRHERVHPDRIARAAAGQIDDRAGAEARQRERHEGRHAERHHRHAPRSASRRRREAAPRARPHPCRAPPLHAPQTVDEHDDERRREEEHPVQRPLALLQHGVGERDEGDRRQERQQRAAGADRERVRGEDGRPQRRDGGEEQRRERRASAPPGRRPRGRSGRPRRGSPAACRSSAARTGSSSGRRRCRRPPAGRRR